MFRNYSLSLGVVQTQAILFLKSMSERSGSDIERLWIWDSSFNFRVVICRIHSFPTLISKIKWLWSGLLLNEYLFFSVQYLAVNVRYARSLRANRFRNRDTRPCWIFVFTLKILNPTWPCILTSPNSCISLFQP